MDVSVGNVVGSSIFNIGVILGITACIRPIHISFATIRRDLLVAFAACLVPLVSLAAGGRVPREVGILLLGLLALYLVVSYRSARRARVEVEAEALGEVRSALSLEHGEGRRRRSAWTDAALAVVGLGLLVVASQLFVDASLLIARAMGIPELVIGLTIVSVGTSLPELVTSLVSAARGNPDIAVGNVIGSNIFNLFGILGVCAIVEPQVVRHEIAMIDTPVLVLATLALIPMVRSAGRMSRWEGALLVLGYTGYGALVLARPA